MKFGSQKHINGVHMHSSSSTTCRCCSILSYSTRRATTSRGPTLFFCQLLSVLPTSVSRLHNLLGLKFNPRKFSVIQMIVIPQKMLPHRKIYTPYSTSYMYMYIPQKFPVKSSMRGSDEDYTHENEIYVYALHGRTSERQNICNTKI